MKILNSLRITGTLTCAVPDASKPLGRYVFQRTRQGHGNVATDTTRTLQIRVWSAGTNPQTPAQQINRAAFADAVAAWQLLPSADRAQLRLDAVGTNMNAYQLWLKRSMTTFHGG